MNGDLFDFRRPRLDLWILLPKAHAYLVAGVRHLMVWDGKGPKGWLDVGYR